MKLVMIEISIVITFKRTIWREKNFWFILLKLLSIKFIFFVIEKKKLVKLCEVYLCTDQVVKKTMKNITILKNERKRKNNPLIFFKAEKSIRDI